MRFPELIDAFMVPSKFTLEKLAAAGIPRKKLMHIPSFVLNVAGDGRAKKRQIAYVGRLTHEKGVHVLLEALMILHNRGIDDFQCIIAGQGPEEYTNRLKSFASQNNLTNVEFTVLSERSEIEKLLCESLLTVAPSICYDNMPNSVLESFSMGTTVIAPDHGSFPEMISDMKTGILYRPGDSVDLAQQIQALLANEELCHHFGSNGRRYVMECHSTQQHYDRIMEVYHQLAGHYAI